VSELLALAGFALASGMSQLAIGRRKVQSRLVLVAAIHLAVLFAILAAVPREDSAQIGGVLIFWSGAGLSWFVVRSHLESSILLAMLLEIGDRSVTREGLIEVARKTHSFDRRLQELRGAGLLRDAAGAPHVTRRGRAVLVVFDWLAAGRS
jgi:hypothetical protein